MPLHCPHCSRVNPDEALYCCHDGVALGARPGGPIAVGAQPFPLPFVFPSGLFCRSFDELVLACEDHWDEARELLRDGMLDGFFGGLGRSDLARTARRCAAKPDADQGLDELLAALPGEVRTPARLAVRPAEVNLGRMSRGTDHRFVVRLLNEGMGLLRGAVALSGTPWLALGEEGAAPEKFFQFRGEQELRVRVIGRLLRAGHRPEVARLAVESSGGSVVIVVRVEAPAVVPFPDGVLAGADTPRRLAEMTRAAPREAAVFFEKGAVAAWYEANGWTYPVQGPPASGIAAVQQFFEALGLAAPPRVELERSTIHLEGPPGAALEAAVVVQTQERRAVFAHGTSAEPWLVIDRAVLAGRTARIPVRVPRVPGRPGEMLCGRMQVTANGNQRFAVAVTVTVTPGAVGEAAPWAADAEPWDADSGPRASGRPGLALWLLAGGFLALAAAVLAVVLVVVSLTPGGAAATTSPVAAPRTDSPRSSGPPPTVVDNPPPRTTPPAPPPPSPDAAELARRLTADDPEVRLDAVRKLEAMGPKAAPALHALLMGMRDGDDALRRRALAAAPRIGAPTADDVGVLADLVRGDAFPDGRTYAMSALAALGKDAGAAAPTLASVLMDHDVPPAMRAKAAETLGVVGGPGTGAHDDLMNALRSGDPEVGAAAAAALNKLGFPRKSETITLESMLSDKAEAARRYALDGLRQLGPDAAGCARSLAESIAEGASPALRRLAVAALLAVAPTSGDSADAFARALSDPDSEVRRAAVEALAKVGPANGATPGLIQALGSDDAAIAHIAEDALKAAHWDRKQVEEFNQPLEQGNTALRLRLLALLKTMGPDAAPALPGVCSVARDGKGEARRQAVAVLAAMGPAARQAGGALDELLKDDSFAVRLEAAVALAAIEGSDAFEAVPVLVDGLRVERLDDPEQAAQRDRAVAALGKIGQPALKPLLEALDNDFVGGGAGTTKARINESARIAAVKALAAMGQAANTSRALNILSTLQKIDPSVEVRRAALEARQTIRAASR